MKKYILLLSAVLLLISASYALENMGARPVSMGGAFLAISDDANAIFENPAGIGYLHGEHAVISTKLSESEYTVFGGVQETPVGNFGIGYISSSRPIDGIASITASDLGDEPVQALNQALILSYGREFNRFSVVPEFMGRMSLGVNIKIASSLLTNAKGLSYSDAQLVNADLAAIFKPREEFSVGFNLRNLFSATRSGGDERFDVAAGASVLLLEKTVTLSATSDGNIGCEWRPMSLLALRAGRDGAYNTAGVGVDLGGFGVDYAYRDSESPVHYVAISLAFNQVPDRDPTVINDAQASLYNY